MAYTKIIKVKSNLNLCLDYTSNPMKTERRSAEDLNKLLNYTQNNDKTEHQLYVSGFNCIPQNAYEIMMETKTRWRKPVKDGNILAYHIIQSFAPGEATPDQVHQIGCEFVQRFLADRFECTVSTHLDRGHLHNHIVVNSVSYADGRMFRSDFNTYYKGIRKTSDELCRENRLSVIETDGKGKSYDEWLSGQTGKPTIRGMVRKDMEQAIAAADSFDGFITELQNMGYTVKYGPRVEHIAVRHKDAQRNIRIDRLDPRFSETALREYYRQLHRMPTEMQQEYRQENAPAKPKWQPTELQPPVQRVRYRGKLPRRYPKVSGFKQGNLRKTGNLDIFCGYFGNGKTLSLVKQVVCREYKRYDGLTVWCNRRQKFVTQRILILSNVDLCVPYERLTGLAQVCAISKANEIYDDEHDTLTITIVCMDELSVQMNSRSFKDNINAYFLNTLMCCRHYHISFYGSAQRFQHVDKMLRDVTMNVVQCKKVWRFQFNSYYDGFQLENAQDPTLVRPLRRACWFVTDADYNAYDTLQVVDNLQKSFNENDMLTEAEILANQAAPAPVGMDAVTPSRKAKKIMREKVNR